MLSRKLYTIQAKKTKNFRWILSAIANPPLFFHKGEFFGFFLFVYDIQHCFICCPSDSTVSEDAGIELRTVATTALAVRRSNHSVRSHPHTRLDLIHCFIGLFLHYVLLTMLTLTMRGSSSLWSGQAKICSWSLFSEVKVGLWPPQKVSHALR